MPLNAHRLRLEPRSYENFFGILKTEHLIRMKLFCRPEAEHAAAKYVYAHRLEKRPRSSQNQEQGRAIRRDSISGRFFFAHFPGTVRQGLFISERLPGTRRSEGAGYLFSTAIQISQA